MKFGPIAMVAVALGAWSSPVLADPGKDESGKGRWRYERSSEFDRPRGRAHGYSDGKRRDRQAFKQEYDDGTCKYERKLEKSGEYKEEVKCRGVRPRRGSAAYDYRY